MQLKILTIHRAGEHGNIAVTVNPWAIMGIIAVICAFLLLGCAKRPAPGQVAEPAPAVLDSLVIGENVVYMDPSPIVITQPAVLRFSVPFPKGSAEPEDNYIVGESWARAEADCYASDERRPGKGWTDDQEAKHNAALTVRRADWVRRMLGDNVQTGEYRGNGETARFGPLEQNRRCDVVLYRE